MTSRKVIKVFGLAIELSRFPNQGYGWLPHKNGKGPKALLNGRGSRFGAGWNYRLGISISERTVMLDLLFGIVMIRKAEKTENTCTCAEFPNKHCEYCGH